MKNITLSVDEKVLRAVRQFAAARNSSVNALVREFLAGIAVRQNRADKARWNIREMSGRSKARTGSKSWKRSELHKR